jgi:hypothetical protein
MTIRDRAEALASVQETRKLGAWTYGVAGQGPAVLLLAGGTGIGIGWLDLVLALHSDYRTIAVDYPPGVSTIDELAQGVLDVLDAENIEAAHVVGRVHHRGPGIPRMITLAIRVELIWVPETLRR